MSTRVGVSPLGRLIRARGRFGGPGRRACGRGVLRVRAHVLRPSGDGRLIDLGDLLDARADHAPGRPLLVG